MKIWIIILTILLIGSNIFWMYTIVDEGITYTYHKSSYERLEKRESIYKLFAMTYIDTLSKSETEKLAYELFDKSDILKKSNNLYIYNIKIK